MNYEEVISRVHVYGLEESVRGSKYPMATDLGKISEDVTPTVVKLATSKQGEGHDNFMNGIIVQMDLTPVSYTHLDVYKRQEAFRLCCY